MMQEVFFRLLYSIRIRINQPTLIVQVHETR